MGCININRIWSDEIMIELEFSANSANIYSQLNFYVTENELLELKEKLTRFPNGKNNSIEWVVGSNEENTDVYFSFRVFIINKQGHVAIEIEMDNKLKQPYTLYSHFYIPTEIASINEFGKNIDNLLTEDCASVQGIAFRN